MNVHLVTLVSLWAFKVLIFAHTHASGQIENKWEAQKTHETWTERCNHVKVSKNI